MPDAIELIQFPRSHFNEKARWGLDWKRLEHRRTDLLPGPHAGAVRKLAPETTVPVVRFGEEVVQGSARILDELERRQPDPPLYPADPTQRERALGIQRWFDDDVGPLVRKALFSRLLGEGGYACRMFAEDHPLATRMVYRAAFPLARIRINRAYRMDDSQGVHAAFEKAREGLDFVVKEAGPDGYLVGDRFSVADLAAAALLAPCCNPPDCAMTLPEPLPDAAKKWLACWSGHPGSAWVLRTYRQHRPPSAALVAA